ncbi:helix-turn-helix domain-containing protein [Bifidobacterium bifidum]
MGEVCSHLSEEERRGIQIEIGNGAGIRGIGLMLGRNASTVNREIKRNTWVPVRRERVLPAVPAETAEDRPVDGRMLHRRPRAAQGRPQARQAAQAPPPVMRTPVGAGGRMAGSRLVAAARQRQAARPVPRRPHHARVPGERLPLGLRRPPSP